MNHIYREISFSQISDSHKYDIHSFLTDNSSPKSLEKSISLTGVLLPPTLLEISANSYDVLCGRQRLKCVSTVLQKDLLLCRVLPRNTSDEEILTYILEDQFTNKELTIIEQACFLRLCNELLNDQKSTQSFINSLPQGRITKGTKFLAALACLPERVKQGIHDGYISAKIVTMLQSFNSKDQNTLLDLFLNLQLGSNNQKKMVEEIFDILQREEISLDDFLYQTNVKEIIHNDELSGAQKTTRLLQLIYQENHPLLSTAEKSFADEVKRLKLPENCTLKATTAFEKEEVTLSMSFYSLDEFKRVWQTLAKHLSTFSKM